MAHFPRAPAWLVKLCPLDRPSLRAVPVRLNGRPAVAATDGCAFTVLPRHSAKRPATKYGRDLARALRILSRDRGPGLKVVPWEAVDTFLAGVRLSAKEPSEGIVARQVTINRQLLKRFLGPLKSPTVKVRFGGELDAVHFTGRGWLVVVMPMRADPAKKRVVRL